MPWESPAKMIIDSAIDNLKDADPKMLANQAHELQSLGDARARDAGASGVTPDFQSGYKLGLQTARMMLRGNPLLAEKGIEPGGLL